MKNILNFLEGLNVNNTKEWFDAHKDEYLQAKSEFEQLVAELIKEIASFDPSIADLEAKKCIFRINRDVRFSSDKRPYKSNFGASFTPGGKKSPLAGYYIHIQPGASFIGGGIYMPEANILKAVRQEIDYNLKEFENILDNSLFKSTFGGLANEGKLSRPPKGYDIDNPANEYLKNKHFIVLRNSTDSEILRKDFLQQTIKGYKAMYPFKEFLNRAIADI